MEYDVPINVVNGGIILCYQPQDKGIEKAKEEEDEEKKENY